MRLGCPRGSGRVLFVVLDGVGVGALPDAGLYGDEDADTLGHVTAFAEARLPHLTEMGLGLVAPLRGVSRVAYPTAAVALLSEHSPGKDSTTGHWEHMGLVMRHGFPTYPDGFPTHLIEELQRRIGRRILGNKAASGFDIMDELGAEHMRSGSPIVYTSADSVFQVAAHVKVVPLEELFDICATARRLLTGDHAVGRVIARPFSGAPGAFSRTRDRRDYSIAPPGPTYLDELAARGIPVVGIGKVGDVFCDRGFSGTQKTDSNNEGIGSALQALGRMSHGLVFVNLNDFDTKYGHRNDVEGFARCLEAFDNEIPRLRRALGPGDLLLITADHGCDPTDVSFDHSREYVPLLVHPRSAVLGPFQRSLGGNRVGAHATRLHVGGLSDSGATAYFHLLGERSPLAGRPLQVAARPAPGRRRSYAPAGLRLVSASPTTTERAAAYLRARMGIPQAAVVLGSGLGEVAALLGGERVACFADIPGWPVGRVQGHDQVIEKAVVAGRTTALLRGRVHGYEGVSRTEEEFAIRTLAALGAECVIVTNASGLLPRRTGAERTASAPTHLLEVGSCAWVSRVIDFQLARTQAVIEGGAGEGSLALLEAPGCSSLFADMPVGPSGRMFGLAQVTYAAVPGPHYETGAEAELLWRLGCDVVGMSAAAEVNAAACRGLEFATLTMVTNHAAETESDGSAGHSAVIRAAARDVARMAAVVERVLSVPGSSRPKGRPSPILRVV